MRSDPQKGSQKFLIFLDLKTIEWTSHSIDLMANENVSPWFLAINPRGLVPVHDGAAYIESNDILILLEALFPDPPLLQGRSADEVAALLRHEGDLHLDLRNLSFRSVVDIAWFIYLDRLSHAGYPVARLHPRLAAWFERLSQVPAFARERQVSSAMLVRAQEVRGMPGARSLEMVAGL